MVVIICLTVWGAPTIGCMYIFNCYIFFLDWGFSRWLSGKESTCNAGDTEDVGLIFIPESGRSPGGVHGNSLQHSCLEIPWSLVGYSPWGHKESEWLKQLSMDTLLRLSPWSFVVTFFLSYNIYFVWYEYCYSSFLLIYICVEYLHLCPSFSVCMGP